MPQRGSADRLTVAQPHPTAVGHDIHDDIQRLLYIVYYMLRPADAMCLSYHTAGPAAVVACTPRAGLIRAEVSSVHG